MSYGNERSVTGKQQGDWMLRVQGFELEALPPDSAVQTPRYDAAARELLTAEIMNIQPWRKGAAVTDFLDDQIQHGYQLPAAAVNEVRFKLIRTTIDKSQ